MRKKNTEVISDYKIMVLDDEVGIIDSLSVVLRRSGYRFIGLTNPVEAIERLRSERFDLLILDYIMEPIHGDEVVAKIREFNRDLYILLLTGHKDLAPPLETIKQLEIQGYCEKSDRFDQLLLLIESGVKSITQRQTITRFKDGLNSILQALPKIYQLQPIGNILEEILAEVLPFANSQNAFILIDDVTNHALGSKSIFKGIGDYNVDIESLVLKLNPMMMEKIGYSRMAKKIVKLQNGVIFPLVNEYSQAMGVIFVESDNFEDGIKLLEIYANQAASSINNAFLHSLVNVKNEELNKTYDELKTRYMDTIEALRLAVDAKDVYTRGHSERVAYYAVKIGKEFGLPTQELEMLKIGGIFHDIGKIGTADDILLKTEKLDNKEYEEIKKHPIKGAHILSAVSMFTEVVPIVKCHHERVDGKGYPEGLKENQIPFLAKIISVADAFDAMTSDRLYRSKLDLDEAIRQLINGAGTQFDANVVNVFVKLLEDFHVMRQELAYTYEK
ncbi:MAG: DUF3369 domain-containing protein [Clostridia bacterium]|nr:DUF3369 domain-containing protein [Clostridia bacterium]